MKPLMLLPLALVTLASNAPAAQPEWVLDFEKWCIFEPEPGHIAAPARCGEYYRRLEYPAADGQRSGHMEYMWRAADGREVRYTSGIGMVGVITFTIGVLSDNRHRGGSTYDPAVAYSPHRQSLVIGTPGDGYEFEVCNRAFAGEHGGCGG